MGDEEACELREPKNLNNLAGQSPNSPKDPQPPRRGHRQDRSFYLLSRIRLRKRADTLLQCLERFQCRLRQVYLDR